MYLSQILSELINNNLIARQQHKNHGVDFLQKGFEKSYLKEFCTISLCTNRGSGHSTAIIDNINHFKNPLVIAYNKSLSDRLKKLYRESNLSCVEPCFTSFCQNSFDYAIRGNTYDGIFIDTASMMTQNKRDTLYDTLTAYMPKLQDELLIIFVG